MRSIITGVCCVLGTLALDQGSTDRAPSAGIYRDATYGFSMNTPRFPALPAGQQNVVATFFAPPEGESSADMKIIVHHGVIPLDQFLAFTEQQIQHMGGKMGQKEIGTVNGREAVMFQYDIMELDKPLRCSGLVVADKERLFFVSGTAAKASFNKYEPLFREALESFKLDEAKGP